MCPELLYNPSPTGPQFAQSVDKAALKGKAQPPYSIPAGAQGPSYGGGGGTVFNLCEPLLVEAGRRHLAQMSDVGRQPKPNSVPKGWGKSASSSGRASPPEDPPTPPTGHAARSSAWGPDPGFAPPQRRKTRGYVLISPKTTLSLHTEQVPELKEPTPGLSDCTCSPWSPLPVLLFRPLLPRPHLQIYILKPASAPHQRHQSLYKDLRVSLLPAGLGPTGSQDLI